MSASSATMLLSDHFRGFLDERVSGEIDPVSATTGAIARQVISEYNRLTNWLHAFLLLFVISSTVLAIVAMMVGTWMQVLILLIGIAIAVSGFTIQARKRSRLIKRYDHQAVFLEAIANRHRKPLSDYLDLFSSGQMNIVDQTGTRIVLKGKRSCYWLLASVEHLLVEYPSLRPVAEFQHPLRVEEPTALSASAQRESAERDAKEPHKRYSTKTDPEFYDPFVKPIAEIDLNKRLLELRQLLGATRWDDQQENAIRVAKQLCETGATWRNQTDFLKDVHAECERKYPQATPDKEKVRRTLSINQDINDKRSLYRRFLTDQSFRSALHAEYGPIQPSLDIDPSVDPS